MASETSKAYKLHHYDTSFDFTDRFPASFSHRPGEINYIFCWQEIPANLPGLDSDLSYSPLTPMDLAPLFVLM